MPGEPTSVIAQFVGGVVGAVVAAVIAVNIVIYAGPEQGYESSPGDLLDHSPVVAIVTLAVLVAGPITGVVIARRAR